jgi:hypothetical protein
MKNVKRSWKTTLLGAITLGLAGLQVYAEPKTAANPETLATITAGIGLILAKDAGVAGTAEQLPRTPDVRHRPERP